MVYVFVIGSISILKGYLVSGDKMFSEAEEASFQLGVRTEETIAHHHFPHAKSKFKQQKVAACRPFLTPLSAAIIYGVFSVLSLAAGLLYFYQSDDIFELIMPYPEDCNGTCTVEFDIQENRTGPFYIYYQIENLYQNNFLYGSSKNWDQLTGKEYSDESDLDSCMPILWANGGKNVTSDVLVPCGAVPMSVFNDTYTFDAGFPEITDKGIALSTFKELFKQPASIYDNDVQWLKNNEMFPGGQTNERFINWVQIAPFRTFRKLWAKTAEDAELIAGRKYRVTLQNNYPVESFNGKKSLIISQVVWLGGKNRFFGVFFLSMCGISAMAAIIFLILYATKSLPLYKHLASSNGTLEMTLLQT